MSMLNTALMALAAGVLAIVASALVLVSAGLAHDGADPMSAWYRSLRTANGGSCCSEADCRPVEARLANDHWEVLIGNGPLPVWEIVPPEVVLTRDNPEGRAVLCRFGGPILCFVPPAGV
jgi:hypothetical protein